MNNIRVWGRAMGIVVMMAFYPQQSIAQGFTGTEFANWSEVSQNSYIQTSVMMAGVIGTQFKPSISSCIDAWYFADEKTKADRNKSIRETIAQYQTYHPSGVILAIIQEQCGAF